MRASRGEWCASNQDYDRHSLHNAALCQEVETFQLNFMFNKQTVSCWSFKTRCLYYFLTLSVMVKLKLSKMKPNNLQAISISVYKAKIMG